MVLPSYFISFWLLMDQLYTPVLLCHHDATHSSGFIHMLLALSQPLARNLRLVQAATDSSTAVTLSLHLEQVGRALCSCWCARTNGRCMFSLSCHCLACRQNSSFLCEKTVSSANWCNVAARDTVLSRTCYLLLPLRLCLCHIPSVC